MHNAAPNQPASPPISAAPALPVRSMTGYAQARQNIDGVEVWVTLKSVNHRFLDLQVRSVTELEPLGPLIERRIKQHLVRGHVDVSCGIERGKASGLQLDPLQVEAYLAAFSSITRQMGRPELLADPDQMLRFPGVLVTATASGSAATRTLEVGLREEVLAVLDEALRELNRVRAQEGAALLVDLHARLQRLGAAVDAIDGVHETLQAGIFERLRRRILELAVPGVPEERLVQEAALVAERSDVSEELTRLRAHLALFVGLLEAGGEVGKKLDFILQELNREVNTLLAKTTGVAAGGLRISELGISMKAEVEKLREQVQNLE